MPKNTDKRPFGEQFWKAEGGEKWVKNIKILEKELAHLDQYLLEHCRVSPGEIILDIGCGGGVTSMALAEQTGPSGSVVGIDVSAVILDIAKKRGEGIGNLEFRLGDAGSDDLGEEIFDLLASRFGLMFFTHPVEAFKNLHRMLKANGRLVFLCWRTFEENPWMGEPAAAVFSILPQPEKPATPDPYAPGPFSLGDQGNLHSVLGNAGWKNITLIPLDTGINLGSMEEAVYMTTQIGPAAKLMEEVTEVKRTAAKKAIQEKLKKYTTSKGVILPGACWIVTAGK